MAWFRNHYLCGRCDSAWETEWSCMCDDDCRHCGARHMSPFDSDDLTYIVRTRTDYYIVLHSPDNAEDRPLYQEVDRFKSRLDAEAFVESTLSD
jgi:hypothetical protein